MLMMDNGAFNPNDKICLSITDYHPESWNPAWTVTHIILGCISFWMQDERTAGSLYNFWNNDPAYHQKKAAYLSRNTVLEHPKFKSVLEYFKPFIGIETELKLEAWAPFIKEKEEEEKKKIKEELTKKYKINAKAIAEETAKVAREAIDKAKAETKDK